MSRLDEYREKKRRSLKRKAYFFGFLFLFFLFLIILLSHWSKININTVTVSGNRAVDTEAVLTLTKTDLAGRYLLLFPKSNSFIYPEKKILNDLKEKFKNFSDVSLSVKNNQTLQIAVVEREDKYLWCGANMPQASDTAEQSCYFMDDNGYIFGPSPYFSGFVYFKFYGSLDPQKDSPIGSYFEHDLFTKIISLKEALEKMNLKIVSFQADPNGDLHFYLSSDADIRFKSDADFDKLEENLQAALDTEPLHTDFAKKYNQLLYIDLRFGNKVYYKFSDSTVK